VTEGVTEGEPQPQPANPQPTRPTASAGFDFNRPTVISLLYLSSFVLGITVLIGVVLAYVWRGEPQAEWERSHYTYLIRTFWLGLIGGIVSTILMLALIGFLLIVGVAVLVIVRCVLSLVNAQKKQPMPDPGTWWV